MKDKMKQRSSKLRTSVPPASRTAKPKRSRTDRALARRLMSLLKSGSDTRIKKVKRIRQSVRTKSYENDLKLSIALERMVREVI
jgi:hypothetical protein